MSKLLLMMCNDPSEHHRSQSLERRFPIEIGYVIYRQKGCGFEPSGHSHNPDGYMTMCIMPTEDLGIRLDVGELERAFQVKIPCSGVKTLTREQVPEFLTTIWHLVSETHAGDDRRYDLFELLENFSERISYLFSLFKPRTGPEEVLIPNGNDINQFF